MNIKVIQWLLAHRDVLLKVVEVAKEFSRHKPYMQQWDVIDKVARLLIPVFTAEDVQPSALLSDELADVATLSAQSAEVQAMGIDWKQLVEVILPVIIAILQALAAKTDK